MRDLWGTAAHGVAIVAVAIAVHANSLHNSWQYDDRHVITENPGIRDLGQVPRFFTDPGLASRDPDKAMYRPLLMATFAANYAWSQLDVCSYHLVNIAVHAGASLAVWLLLGALGLSPFGRLAGGLLFAVHPVVTEPVNYISSRSESLSAVFVLASLVLYDRSLGPDRKLSRAASVLCFAAGLLCKSMAITAPALLGLMDWSRHRPWRQALPRYLPYGAVALAYLALVRTFLLRAVVEAPVRSQAVQLGTQAKAAVHYLKLLAVPTQLNVHHPFRAAGLDPAVVASVLFVASAAALLWHWRHRARRTVLALAWMAVTLSPTVIVPLNILVNDHRLYLPLAGAALLPGLAVPRGGRGARALVWATLAALAVLAFQRNRVWETPHTLWSDALRQAPADAVAYTHLGNYAKVQGMPQEAVGYYEKALGTSPGDLLVRNNLGTAYQALGQHQRAVGIFLGLLREEPELAEARYNLGLSYQALGRDREALDSYLAVSAGHYHFDAALNNAGTVYERLGQVDSAAVCYGRALALRPGSPDALGNARRLLARLSETAPRYLESGQVDRLLTLSQALHRIAPQAELPQYYLSASLLLSGQVGASIEAAQALVDGHPDFEEGYLQLANALETAGRRAEAVQAYRPCCAAGRAETWPRRPASAWRPCPPPGAPAPIPLEPHEIPLARHRGSLRASLLELPPGQLPLR
ncbi:MAG: tetratricopeptide repeat protein [Gemmatimonadota bacterium]